MRLSVHAYVDAMQDFTVLFHRIHSVSSWQAWPSGVGRCASAAGTKEENKPDRSKGQTSCFLPLGMIGLGERERDGHWYGICCSCDHPSSPPTLPSSFPLLLLGKIRQDELLGFVSILFLASAASSFPSSINQVFLGLNVWTAGPAPPPLWYCDSYSPVAVSHRASRCHLILGELLRMEVLYWWPLCLFSLPLLLVLLSTLLSYLGVPLCVCVCVCVNVDIFSVIPPMSKPMIICDLFVINVSTGISKMAKVGGVQVLLK